MQCPKCNFVQENGSSECIKCGIIFSKLRGQPLSNETTLLIDSNIPRREISLFLKIFRPVANVKTGIQKIYEKIMDLIWDELLKSENNIGELNNLIAFLIFSIFSMGFYYLRDYDDLILLSLGLIWLLDYLISKYSYHNINKYDRIRLLKKGPDFLYKYIGSQKENNLDIAFKKNEISHLKLDRNHNSGGIFQELMGISWRTYIVMNDEATLLLFDEATLLSALKASEKIASFLDVQLKIANSETLASHCAVNRLQIRAGLNVDHTRDRVKIKTKLDHKSIRNFIFKILRESGFLLFLLIMAGVMIRFGALLNHYIGPYLGMERSLLRINVSFSGVLSLFKPDFGWLDIIEYSVAIGVMIFAGRQLFHSKCVSVDRRKIRYEIGNKVFAELDAQKARPPVYIKGPEPMLFITDMNGIIEIENLGTEADYIAFWSETRNAMNIVQTGSVAKFENRHST